MPGVRVMTSPAGFVNVKVPPFALTFTPHSSGFIPGRHGMTITSTTICCCPVACCAIADADGSINKPAKISALIQPCLYTRDTLFHSL